MLMPLLSIGLYATPALASHWSDDINVNNTNSAYVKNEVGVVASTGDNDANGGSGSAAGNGGDVSNSDDNNTGGNGGNGGNGGEGGIIFTGDAVAISKIKNKVNTNVTSVDPCDCDVDDINVNNNNNSAKVKNYVGVLASTGSNTANGGDAGCDCQGGGDGGSVSNSDDDNTGGNGGNAGHGGWGGLISTGDATAKSKIFNKVNTNITRIP